MPESLEGLGGLPDVNDEVAAVVFECGRVAQPPRGLPWPASSSCLMIWSYCSTVSVPASEIMTMAMTGSFLVGCCDGSQGAVRRRPPNYSAGLLISWRVTHAAIWLRLDRPSLVRTCWTWFCAVRSETRSGESGSAISLHSPERACRATRLLPPTVTHVVRGLRSTAHADERTCDSGSRRTATPTAGCPPDAQAFGGLRSLGSEVANIT